MGSQGISWVGLPNHLFLLRTPTTFKCEGEDRHPDSQTMPPATSATTLEQRTFSCSRSENSLQPLSQASSCLPSALPPLGHTADRYTANGRLRRMEVTFKVAELLVPKLLITEGNESGGYRRVSTTSPTENTLK